MSTLMLCMSMSTSCLSEWCLLCTASCAAEPPSDSAGWGRTAILFRHERRQVTCVAKGLAYPLQTPWHVRNLFPTITFTLHLCTRVVDVYVCVLGLFDLCVCVCVCDWGKKEER